MVFLGFDTKEYNVEEPVITRSINLTFLGDWGGANFHRICSWLTQELCDRTGPRSTVSIRNLRDGGMEALSAVHDGEVHLSIATPAKMLKNALTGDGMFIDHPMPDLRALAVLPQVDRMVLAIQSKFGVQTFEDLRRKKPALRIAASSDDGTNLIGYVGQRLMEAHGISEDILKSWGGEYIKNTRPEQSIGLMAEGKADALLQEAIMTPWWSQVMDNDVVPIPAEPRALALLNEELGLPAVEIRAGFWNNLEEKLPALDFSDFVIFVREDLPDDIAYLLTWALVETRFKLEAQYKHLPSERSPLSYPLDPHKMANTPLPLHPGAKRYYKAAGILQS